MLLGGMIRYTRQLAFLGGRRSAPPSPALPPGMPRRDAQPASPAPDELVLDAQTFSDLEIFESAVAGASLFDLCNLTRNKKGAKALRERMRRPWSNAARIRAVQESLSFILAHRPAFQRLPSFVTTDLVENYLRGTLPLTTSDNLLEFCLAALDLRLGDLPRYSRIRHGVQATCSLIRALRRIFHAAELAEPPGELAQVAGEMRELLARPGIAGIAEQQMPNPSAWKVLRIDRTFRMHEKHALARLLHLTYETDALLAMAETMRKHELVMPQLEVGPLRVHAEGLVHPAVPAAVANPLDLDQQRRVLFLTGPNMAGKTTYLRACALALYLAHLGMGVPARSFRFVPAQRLFSSINLADDLHGGVSYFRAEALRVKAIAQAVAKGYRVIAFMDEPFKGTNVKDAFDASRAVLERLAVREDCLCMFSSHLIELCGPMNACGRIDFRHFEAGEHEGRLRFDYMLRPGVSCQRLGMRVLREEGIFELFDGK